MSVFLLTPPHLHRHPRRVMVGAQQVFCHMHTGQRSTQSLFAQNWIQPSSCYFLSLCDAASIHSYLLVHRPRASCSRMHKWAQHVCGCTQWANWNRKWGELILIFTTHLKIVMSRCSYFIEKCHITKCAKGMISKVNCQLMSHRVAMIFFFFF